MSDEKPNPFNIIRYRGQANKATFEGVEIRREEAIYAGQWGMVRCAPYDEHFVFQIPPSRLKYGRWETFCTCGSMAGIVGFAGEGKMLVCLFYHGQMLEDGHGYHQTTIINKKDFKNIAGQTIELPKGKKWLV
jgi:hypothetical protein